MLLAVQPVIPGDVSSVILYVDTYDGASQTPYTGFYRLGVQTDGAGAVQVSDRPLLLLEEGQYRGPLVVSPDLSRLVYFVHDAAVPSLTSGAVKPANTVKLLTLPGRDQNTASTVYTSESRFEFVAPVAAWLGPERVLLARSRFGGSNANSLDQFAIVQVQLPPGGSAEGPVAAGSYLLPRRQSLLDFAACLDGTALLLTRDGDGVQSLARWEGQGQSFPLFGLPGQLDRTLLCWQAQAQ
jgi:hypothetical protein